jgi:hypothetical protein
MHFAEVFVMEGDLDSHLLGDAEGLGDARVVDIEADRAADEGEVGAVSAVRRGERRMEIEVHRGRVLIEDLARDAAEACRAGRVRAGRTDHDRTHHIEDADLAVVANNHLCTLL